MTFRNYINFKRKSVSIVSLDIFSTIVIHKNMRNGRQTSSHTPFSDLMSKNGRLQVFVDGKNNIPSGGESAGLGLRALPR